MNRKIALSTATLALVAGAAVAAPASAWTPYRLTTVESASPGCGEEGLSMTVEWRPLRGDRVYVRSVFVDGPDGRIHHLGVTGAEGTLYAGPNGHDVGDHENYYWTQGWELVNGTDDEWVPIGASDANPEGWAGVLGSSVTVRGKVVGEPACDATVTL